LLSHRNGQEGSSFAETRDQEDKKQRRAAKAHAIPAATTGVHRLASAETPRP
jgi:hypothetical protein